MDFGARGKLPVGKVDLSDPVAWAQGALNRVKFVRLFTGPLSSTTSASDIENASHDALANGHGDRSAGIGYLESTLKSLRAGHGDGAHPVIPKVLFHFEGQFIGLVLHLEINCECVEMAGGFPVNSTSTTGPMT
jgi:hypothetical protein